MDSFSNVNWRAWQLPNDQAGDAGALEVIKRRMLIDTDIRTEHGAIRDLERRVAALEARLWAFGDGVPADKHITLTH